jgi:hypothetical protein
MLPKSLMDLIDVSDQRGNFGSFGVTDGEDDASQKKDSQEFEKQSSLAVQGNPKGQRDGQPKEDLPHRNSAIRFNANTWITRLLDCVLS